MTDIAPQAGSASLFSEPPEPSENTTRTERVVAAPFGQGPFDAAPVTPPPAVAPSDDADRDAPGNPAWSSPSTDATGHRDEADPRGRRRGSPPAPRRTHR